MPIVLGALREDYYQEAPPNSYINVDDFGSIKQLTDYIRYLDRNDTAYANYFAWKEHGRIIVSFFSLVMRVGVSLDFGIVQSKDMCFMMYGKFISAECVRSISQDSLSVTPNVFVR